MKEGEAGDIGAGDEGRVDAGVGAEVDGAECPTRCMVRSIAMRDGWGAVFLVGVPGTLLALLALAVRINI
jgi:hypothetical protein